MRLAALLLPIAILAGEPPSRVAGFTIAGILSSPFPTEITAAPDGRRVAWISNHEGRRNVWVAEGPSFAPRALTKWNDDDGRDLAALQWSPDGRGLVVVRGGNANRAGEIPNPTLHAGGADQAIWWIPASGAVAPRRLAAGASPRISPVGDVVAFLLRGQVHAVNVTGRARPVRLVSVRGRAVSLRWSPSGDRLAFVSARGTHAYIGVYHAATRAVRFMAPSVDEDGEPTWSPDGRHIAFVRQPHDPDALLFVPRREALPWSILVADAQTGQAREVWRAEKGAGSIFHGHDGDAQILWTARDRLVFPWERDGWTHLYSVQAAGGSAALLTPGPFEVEDAVLAPDRRAIVFVSNQDDIDRRHLWRVADDGRTSPVAITSGEAIEWAPAPLARGGGIVFARSGARVPAHVAVLADGGARAIDLPGRASSPAPETLVTPHAVTFEAADGMRIPAQLFLPPAGAPGAGGRRPAVVFFHGGPRRQMLLGWHYRLYYHHAYSLNQYLASRGMVVLSVNYRSGIGYGRDFREATDYGAAGASEFNDVTGAARYLRSRDDVDPARIAAWGGSYGGYLTAMALARAPDLYATGVDIHGVHDWNAVIRNFHPEYDPLRRPETAAKAWASSPLASLDRWRAPVLVIHGDDDRNVPFSETVDLVARLRTRGVEVEQLVLPNEVHTFLRHESWVRVCTATVEYLQKKLSPAAAGHTGGDR